MSMSVLSQMRSRGADIYYTLTWRQVVETHLIWLRARTESEVVVIEPHIAYKYEGDLYGALQEIGIPSYLHWTVMRVNGLYSPVDFQGETTVMMIPSRDVLNQLAAMAQSTQRKIT